MRRYLFFVCRRCGYASLFLLAQDRSLWLRLVYYYCPGYEAMCIIVVSLSCTAYLCGSFTGVICRSSAHPCIYT